MSINTPYYRYNLSVLDQVINSCRDAGRHFNYNVHYAMKANSNRTIIKKVLSKGLGIDAVSGWEIERALEMGCEPSKIVFAGVGKTDAEIIFALEKGIGVFHIESIQELNVINNLAKKFNCNVSVALRLNPNIDPKTHPKISTGLLENKFGISMQYFGKAIEELNRCQHLKWIGCHFHIGSQISDLRVFESVCDQVNILYSKHKDLSYLNLGGGLAVNYRDPTETPAFMELFSRIHKRLNINQDISVHFELGRSIVANCGELITSVLFEKKVGDRQTLIVDAGMNDLLRPALYGAEHMIENISSQLELCEYEVVGPVCESSDVFSRKVAINKASRGDLLVIKSSGAYGQVMASQYNLRPLAKEIYLE